MVLQGPRRLLIAVTCALFLSACGATTYVDSNPDQPPPLGGAGWQGIEPIEVTMPTDDPVRGDRTTYAPEPGVPVLVNIWASFCEPCKDELPLLQQVADDGTFEVVGFTRDSHRDRAQKALSAARVAYPNWMDPDAEMALALDGRVPINGIPSTILVRDGKAVAVHIGPFTGRADILAALEIR